MVADAPVPQSFFDGNDAILRGKGRKQTNFIFHAIHNGTFEVPLDSSPSAYPSYILITWDLPAHPCMSCSYRTERKRDKHKHIPAELQDQWERDRAKKAERKRLRELERIAAASAEFFTPTKKKKGKKARKARQAVAVAAMSLETVAEQMRAFTEDLGSARTLSLPPMTKHMRKSVHDLAHAFHMNSKSEGNGAKRFTTLTKTTWSGLPVDERKVARILGKTPPPRAGGDGKGKGKGKAVTKIRARDGEVVGGVRFSQSSRMAVLISFVGLVGCTKDRRVECRV